MINFKTWLLDRVPLNAIESIVIGQHALDNGNSDEPHLKAQHGFLNIPLERDKALALLDYECSDVPALFDTNAVYIYTKDSVYFIEYEVEYNRSNLKSIPRNPCKCIPEFI